MIDLGFEPFDLRLCKDCKHLHSTVLNFCKRPGHGVDPVTGEIQIVLASVERSPTITKVGDMMHKSNCGPDGTFWEKKEHVFVPKEKWWKFWK